MDKTIPLSERQKLILGLVVQEYVNTASPVGSQNLVNKYKLDISSATVRNEMLLLADAGYLRQPHTSAGRVPTEEGYRFFVGQLMQRADLPSSIKHTISHQFYQARRDTNEWMRLAASVLAHQSNAAAIVTSPHTDKAEFKHVQLISTTGRQVLMVLVLMNGKVSQQMLVLSEPVTQEHLSTVADQLNKFFNAQTIEEIRKARPELDTLGKDMQRLVVDEMKKSNEIVSGEVYQDGWTNVLSEPEFSRSDAARRALNVLEERSMLEDLLSQTVMKSDIGGVQVLIGGEGNWEELSECSLVLARYGVPELGGILGVLGPIRMPYDHTISTVNYVAGLLSNMVSESMDGILDEESI